MFKQPAEGPTWGNTEASHLQAASTSQLCERVTLGADLSDAASEFLIYKNCETINVPCCFNPRSNLLYRNRNQIQVDLAYLHLKIFSKGNVHNFLTHQSPRNRSIVNTDILLPQGFFHLLVPPLVIVPKFSNLSLIFLTFFPTFPTPP